jgi:hypothetical protein
MLQTRRERTKRRASLYAIGVMVLLVSGSSALTASAHAETATLFDSGTNYSTGPITPFPLLKGQHYEVTVSGTYSVWPSETWNGGTCGGTPGVWEGLPESGPTGLDGQYVFSEPASSSFVPCAGSFPVAYEGACVFTTGAARNLGYVFEQCMDQTETGVTAAHEYSPTHVYHFTITGEGEPAGVGIGRLRPHEYSEYGLKAVYGGLSVTITGPLTEGNGGGGGAPSAVTGGVSNVTSTSATLNGSVTPGEDALKSCYFEYGETSNVYGSTVPCAQTVGAGTSPVSVSASLTGLTPGTTYHVRLVATSSAGTGYGSDETFTTTGTSAPTVQTGYAYGGWSSTADLTGTINPHGNGVEYEFRYGASPVAVSSYGDILTGYWGHTPRSSVAGGTSSEPVSVAIGGLAPHTPYYVRLVAFYNGSVAWGNEVKVEITPPEPEAHEAPYLALHGDNATQGYTVYCVPGRWTNANSFATRWVYETSGGATGSAQPGAASGAEYHVSKADIGHVLGCVVSPYEFDGTPRPDLALRSDTLIPEGGGAVVLPTFLKAVWDTLDVYSFATGKTALACGLSFVEPELAPVCLVGLFDEAATTVFADAIKGALDPPDSHYKEIALPRRPNVHADLHRLCPRRVTGRSCRVLVARARAYENAAGEVGALLETFAVSRNRTLVARKAHDSETEMTQSAARKVYAGLLVGTVTALQHASVVYAEALRRVHLDTRISAATLKVGARRSVTSIYGRPLIARLLSHGFTRSEVQRALAPRARRRVTGFDLQSYLRKPVLPVPFGRYYDTIEINDLMTLASSLARQHALAGNSVQTLLGDLDKTRAACTLAARAAATQRFLQDAKPNSQSQFYGYLSTAAQPLIDGSSTVDPYPRCVP